MGGAVDVRYLPDDPEQAEIDRATMWVPPAVVDTVAGPETSDPAPMIAGPEISEPIPELRPPPPKVASGRVGDKLTVHDEFGDAQLEVTLTRVKLTGGDAFNQPQRGLYLGAYVKAHALADDQFLLGVDPSNGAGCGRHGVVRGCPLGTGRAPGEWHASGMAGEDVDAGPAGMGTSSTAG